MTVVKINALTVPADSGDELAWRFAARVGAVDTERGFEGFELLRPTDGRNRWLVVTRWKDEASFEAWVTSPAFAHGHAGSDRPPAHGGPLAVSSESWSYEVAGGSPTQASS
ncbi:MAG: antibiotic biosynthesis monooxygenase [Acidimicrobiales bacterium]|jgi:heme-degrading monooxygenase HmoA